MRWAGRRGGRRCALRPCDVLKGDNAGVRLFFGGDDANLKTAGHMVEVQVVEGGASVGIGCDHIGAQAAGERAARAILGKVEADGRAFNRTTAFIGDLHSEEARAVRAGGVHGAFSLDYLNLQYGDLPICRASQRYSQRRDEAQSGEFHFSSDLANQNARDVVGTAGCFGGLNEVSAAFFERSTITAGL